MTPEKQPDTGMPDSCSVPKITQTLLLLFAGALTLLTAHIDVTPATFFVPPLSAGMLAFVLFVSDSRKPLMMLIPVIFAAALLSKSLTGTLSALLFFPLLPAALGIAPGKKNLRVPILISAVLVSLFFVLIHGGSILARYGSVSAETVKEAIQEPLNALRTYMTSIRTQFNGEEYAVFTAQQAEAYINYLIGLFPAVIGIAALLMAWASAWVFRILNRFMQLPDTRSPWEIEMPLSASVLFIAAFLLTETVSDGIFEMTAMNVYLLFLPGFTASGIRLLARQFRPEGKPGTAVLCLLLLMAVSMQSPVYGLMLLSFIGALPCLFRGILTRLRRKEE